MNFDDEAHVEIRGIMRRVQPRDPPSEEKPVTFGTGDSPQIMPDYSGVFWPSIQSTPFYFNGRAQRDVVRELWTARQRGRPYVNQLALLRLVESRATRLVELFRQGAGYHPAWGTLIVKGPVAGSYGLPG